MMHFNNIRRSPDGESTVGSPGGNNPNEFSGMLTASLNSEQARLVLSALGESDKKGYHFFSHPTRGWLVLINDGKPASFDAPYESHSWSSLDRQILPAILRAGKEVMDKFFPNLDTTPVFIKTILADTSAWGPDLKWKVGVTPNLRDIFARLKINPTFEM